ncbi:hypothetical protein [Sebaldella termitidis]|uniref:hypothetical protein n=1 Tax=Sebaldella termitidis TaxID=826 RepID=UPI003EC01B7E
MNIYETLKKAREDRHYTYRQVQNFLNNKGIKYDHSNIKRLEDGEKAKIPIEVLNALCDIYKLDKIKMFNLAGANLSEENSINTYKLDVYALDTAGDGGILNECEEAVFVLPANFKLEDGSFVLEIIGDYLEPELRNKDKVLVQNIKVEDWKELNNKIIVFNYKNKKMSRRLKYKSGSPVLESFTGYDEDIKIGDKNIEYLGVISTLIERNLF